MSAFRRALIGAVAAIPVSLSLAWAQEDLRWEIAARGMVENCQENEKIMTHDPAKDKMVPGGALAQTWFGSCAGSDAPPIRIVCLAVLGRESPAKCFLR